MAATTTDDQGGVQYSLKNLLRKNPVQISGVVQSCLNLLIIVHVVNWSAVSVAAGNTALLGVLGLFVVQNTVNSQKLRELDQVMSPSPPVATPTMLQAKEIGQVEPSIAGYQTV